jgi:hypothetical protein
MTTVSSVRIVQQQQPSNEPSFSLENSAPVAPAATQVSDQLVNNLTRLLQRADKLSGGSYTQGNVGDYVNTIMQELPMNGVTREGLIAAAQKIAPSRPQGDLLIQAIIDRMKRRLTNQAPQAPHSPAPDRQIQPPSPTPANPEAEPAPAPEPSPSQPSQAPSQEPVPLQNPGENAPSTPIMNGPLSL